MKDKFFGPIRPSDESHYVWTILIAIMVFLVAGVSIGFLSTLHISEELTNASKVLGLAQDLATDSASAGGDVFIAPPVILPPQLPEKLSALPDPEKFSAKSIIVKDVASGAVLYRKNEYDVRPIASLTKLMSALTILERKPDWSATAVVVDDEVVDTHMFAGDVYTLEELWQAALIGSSNKAILTLSDAVGWPREAFVERMNQKAREYGMSNARFVEPTGIEDGNVASASDIAILLDEALKSPKIQATLLEKELTIYSTQTEKSHHLWSTNWLLLDWVPSDFVEFHGGKTGYIPQSGYNFIMQTSDVASHKITVVVLGASSHESRFTEARDIGQWTHDNYLWP